MTIHARVLFISMPLLALALVAGCSSPPDDEPPGPAAVVEDSEIGPPVEADLSTADAAVAELLRSLVQQARQSPDDAQARASLGMGYEVNGLPQAAVESYRQAVAMQPDQPRWSYYLATARAKLGDLDGALEAMNRVVEQADVYVPAHLHRGAWLMDLGREDEAQTAYERAVALQPKNPAGSFGLARVHLKRKEGAKAVELLEALQQEHPANPYLHQLLGMAYREVGDLDRAREALSRGAPGAEPGWPDPWHDEKAAFQAGFGAGMLKAEDLMSKGKMQEAIELYESLRAERPDDVALINNLAVAYRNVGNDEKAFLVLQQGLADHPDYYPFHLNLSAAYERRGDGQRALHHIDRALEIYPTLSAAHERKGRLLVRMRQIRPALASFDEALRYDARNLVSLVNAGVIEADLGNWAAGKERMAQAIRLDPRQFAAYVVLGRCHAELGEYDLADEALRRAAELNPNNATLTATRERLEELRAGTP